MARERNIRPTIPLEIGQRIRERREYLSLQSQWLAELLGVTTGYMSIMETGRRRPSHRMLQKLAKALRCTVEDLTGDQPIRPALSERERKARAGAYRKRHPEKSYQGLKRWRDTHRDEDMRRDKLYKQLKRDGPWRDAWLQIRAHYMGRCLACGTKEDIVPDHVLPVSMGGTNHPGNLQPLCRLCNGVKYKEEKDYRPDHGAWCRALMPEAPISY